MDALKQALGRMNESAGGGESRDAHEAGGETGGGDSDLHSVHHLNHGSGKHSVHKVHHDGKAESSMHNEGEEQTCPLCGK